MKTHKRKILYIQFTNPTAYPPLEHSSRILANQGWDVLFLGAKSFGANFSFPSHVSIRVRLLSHEPSGVVQKIQYFFYILWVIAWSIIWKPCWIYASESFSTPIALLLSYLPWMRVIYHEHDTPYIEQRTSQFMKFIFVCRKRLANRAAACILPNQKRLEEFKQETGTNRPLMLVWNCPRRDEVCSPVKREPNGCTLWYHGTLVETRLPMNFLEALSKLPSVKLVLAGYSTIGDPLYLEQFLHYAEKLGIGKNVQYIGSISRSELLSQSQVGDVGLAFYSELSAEKMVSASNKPFDYMASGLALLVLDHPAYTQMYVEPGYGLACDPDNVESISAALQWFLVHPEETRQMGAKGQQRILSEWNYERQFQPVLDFIEQSHQNRQ